jgi:hypothetical protein
LWGILALLWMILALIPLLGWGNFRSRRWAR